MSGLFLAMFSRLSGNLRTEVIFRHQELHRRSEQQSSSPPTDFSIQQPEVTSNQYLDGGYTVDVDHGTELTQNELQSNPVSVFTFTQQL